MKIRKVSTGEKRRPAFLMKKIKNDTNGFFEETLNEFEDKRQFFKCKLVEGQAKEAIMLDLGTDARVRTETTIIATTSTLNFEFNDKVEIPNIGSGNIKNMTERFVDDFESTYSSKPTKEKILVVS